MSDDASNIELIYPFGQGSRPLLALLTPNLQLIREDALAFPVDLLMLCAAVLFIDKAHTKKSTPLVLKRANLYFNTAIFLSGLF